MTPPLTGGQWRGLPGRRGFHACRRRNGTPRNIVSQTAPGGSQGQASPELLSRRNGIFVLGQPVITDINGLGPRAAARIRAFGTFSSGSNVRSGRRAQGRTSAERRSARSRSTSGRVRDASRERWLLGREPLHRHSICRLGLSSGSDRTRVNRGCQWIWTGTLEQMYDCRMHEPARPGTAVHQPFAELRLPRSLYRKATDTATQHPFDHLSAGSMSSWIPSPPAHPRDTRGPVGCVGYYPEGYRIRCMRIGEEAARVGVHRRAWRPASLPWPPEVDVSGISPAATSRFTAEHFQLLRRTWLYRQDLDLVVEAPDGALAGCCTVWWDPKVGCAEVEPLGVVPRYRRKGAWLRVVPGGRTTGLGQGWDPDVRERWAATGLSSTGRHLPPCGLRRRPPWHLFRPLSAGRG